MISSTLIIFGNIFVRLIQSTNFICSLHGIFFVCIMPLAARSLHQLFQADLLLTIFEFLLVFTKVFLVWHGLLVGLVAKRRLICTAAIIIVII